MDAPAALYLPGGHGFAVDEAVPSGQKCPAAHPPVHAALVEPAEPYLPAVHGEQFDAPSKLYVPGGHTIMLRLVVPAGQ